MNQPLLQMDLRLVGVALLVLGGAVAAIWWMGRRVREALGPVRGPQGVRETLGAGPPVPSQVARKLQERGLVTPAQLANMTEMERQLLFSSMAGVIDQEVGPQLTGRSAGMPVSTPPGELPTLYCPTCGYRIERFSSTPPVTGQCETCGAKIVVRRDGPRMLLTVLPKDETEARRPDLRLEP